MVGEKYPTANLWGMLGSLLLILKIYKQEEKNQAYSCLS